jgi:hypothetical protein
MHPGLKKDTKHFHYTSILMEFLVISVFYKTKIPTANMKVQMSSNFSKKIWKKMKSPRSMSNGRLNTSMCRGKFQKMGVLYTHFPKIPSPFPNFPKKSKNL